VDLGGISNRIEMNAKKSVTLKGEGGGGGAKTGLYCLPVAVHQNQCGELRVGEVANTLSTNGNASGRNAPLVAVFENHGQDSRITGPLEVAPTISRKFGTGGNNVPLVASFAPTSFGQYAKGVGTLKANGGDLGGGSETLVFAMQGFGDYRESETASALKSRDFKDATDLVGYGYAVRRLTPTECERLQGFPDGWTAYGHDGKPISDTQRYKALGNSVAIPCVEFIMRGIRGATC